jgi:hypothetical protein
VPASAQASGIDRWLVGFHSEMMRMVADHTIAAGMPGAGVIRDCDEVVGRVSGAGELRARGHGAGRAGQKVKFGSIDRPPSLER